MSEPAQKQSRQEQEPAGSRRTYRMLEAVGWAREILGGNGRSS
jgi:hypothetical protein